MGGAGRGGAGRGGAGRGGGGGGGARAQGHAPQAVWSLANTAERQLWGVQKIARTVRVLRCARCIGWSGHFLAAAGRARA